MLRIIVAALLVAAASAGCKGGGSSESGGPPVITEEAFRWSAEQAVNAALITENDLPANFDLVPAEADDDDEEDPPVLLTGECAEFNELVNVKTNFVAAVAEAETGDFEDENEDGFSANAGAFRDEAAAEHEASTYERLIDMCTDQLEAGFVQYFLDLGANNEIRPVTAVSVEMQEIPVRAQGDWALGMHMVIAFTVDGVPFRFVVDSVSVRVGRIIGTIDYGYSGEPDIALRDGVVATIAERLAAEDEKLPG